MLNEIGMFCVWATNQLWLYVVLVGIVVSILYFKSQ